MTIEKLLEIMARLRDPHTGCPWDAEQDFSSIAPYTIEEAYEVADAIERNDMGGLRDELGDLLFQVVFHAQMASEGGSFDFDDVVSSLCEKMIRRHPHVFGDGQVENASAQKKAWEQVKALERQQKGLHSVLDDVPRGMAELQRSIKLQKRAADIGFDWPDPEPVLDKFNEEAQEVREAIISANSVAVEEEIGDLLFVVTNLARKLEVDPARALRRTNAKFEARFKAMEELCGGQEKLAAMDLDEMEALWQSVKREESG
ncbi:MAG TPA: nucleoside triphosphate pyrophosphohydrolase [Xanthomonadales bacterium]|nr:nucleoside triphosphate pyrophosphohydrolase [Xanthomonadales bacterium]